MGDEDKPYFSMKYLVENFMGLTQADIKANEEAIKRKEKEKEEKEGEEKEGGEKEEEGGEKEEVTL
jgi:hypothetical protein